ncbi:hypothetical protein RIVM261_079880 [Rivularia sp. IAM M-261]|nr:hypothetical protein RIVM261_079880 [Rivularia sp. IAM M-261]
MRKSLCSKGFRFCSDQSDGRALGAINPELKDIFRERCRKIKLDASGLGWGFEDALCEAYEFTFGKK